MRLIDLSQPIFHGSPNCPTHPPVISELIACHETDGWQVEMMTLSNHTGSHIDAPLHRIRGGASLDEIPLERFVGPARIADLRGCKPNLLITPQVLSERLPTIAADDIVLLATGWGDLRAKDDRWHYDSPKLTPEGGQWLVDHRVRGVGIDHYSIAGIKELNPATHSVVLGSGMWIVEELRFPAEVFALPQPVQFWALPINLQKHSGGFCRPVVVAP